MRDGAALTWVGLWSLQRAACARAQNTRAKLRKAWEGAGEEAPESRPRRGLVAPPAEGRPVAAGGHAGSQASLGPSWEAPTAGFGFPGPQGGRRSGPGMRENPAV